MNKYFDLTGKVAMVTGASSGLGASAAVAYAEAGAKVAVLARRLEKLEETKRRLKQLAVRLLQSGAMCPEKKMLKGCGNNCSRIWHN